MRDKHSSRRAYARSLKTADMPLPNEVTATLNVAALISNIERLISWWRTHPDYKLQGPDIITLQAAVDALKTLKLTG